MHQHLNVVKDTTHARYDHIYVDTEKSFAHYKKWLQLTRPAPGPGGLRRPLWFGRPNKPRPEAYRIPE